jgi:lysozyme
MRASSAAVELIKEFELLHMSPHLDSSGVPTIGFGHTAGVALSTPPVTEPEAVQMLLEDMARYEQAVHEAVRVPLVQHEFDALVSFTFSVGVGALRTSMLLRSLNAGDRAAAACEFQKWNRASKGGQMVVTSFLVARRAAERRMFEGRSGT